jgi:hypothetical protein
MNGNSNAMAQIFMSPPDSAFLICSGDVSWQFGSAEQK